MELNNRLYDLFVDKAKKVKIELLSVGLGYTGVLTSDGGMGVAYTCFENKHSCSIVKTIDDYENKPASDLLVKIKSMDMIERSMALALINALNYEYAFSLPEDPNNHILFEKFGIREGTKVAMVGYFGPLLKVFEKKKASLEIIDASRGLGQKEEFDIKLGNWADVLFLTSTSILNNTTEEILGKVGKNVKTVMLGPSTPMAEEAFEGMPIHMLAGTVPIGKDEVLKAIRHGKGTPAIQKFSRKSFLSFI